MIGPLKLLLAMLFVILLSGFSSASDIYIAQNAAGGNTGADCADAHAASWFNSSANWGSGAGKIGPGTTAHLCGTLTTALTALGSGTSGNPITILFESGAQISLAACGSTGCLNIAAKSYITIDGGTNGLIQATNVGTGLSNGDSVAVYARSGSSHIEVKNLTITNMYVITSPSDNSASGSYYGLWNDGDHMLFHNNTIHDCYAGVKTESDNNSSYYSNTIYNNNWGIFLSGNSTNGVNHDLIYGNEIYDFDKWDTTADTYHHDGIFLAGNGTPAHVQNNQIYNNYLHGTISNSSNCPVNCMTAYIFLQDVETETVYNNLLVAPSGQYVNNGLITINGSVTQDQSDALYNNTVIGGQGSSTGACIAIENEANLSFENNVMSNCGVNIWLVDTNTFTVLDYNSYQDSSLNGTWRISSSFYNTLAAWQAASGEGSHAQATTGSLNLNGSYEPLSNSILVGAAKNLTGLGVTALDSDKAGVARPAGSTSWDAGAYQDPSSNPAPPTGLGATVR